jgi:hypothetical protein
MEYLYSLTFGRSSSKNFLSCSSCNTLFTLRVTISSVEKEVQQGKNQIDAAKEAGVTHIVVSTLEGVTKVAGDRLKKIHGWACAHFDSKDQITEYAKASGANVTYLYTSFYVSPVSSIYSQLVTPRKCCAVRKFLVILSPSQRRRRQISFGV